MLYPSSIWSLSHVVLPAREGFRLTRTLSWIISLLRAYVFGYLSSTGPRILTTLFLMLRKGQSKTDTIAKLLLVLRGALAINRFPTFCGVLVGGSTLLELPIQRLLVGLFHALHFQRGQGTAQRLRVFARFLATAIAAYSGLALLNSTPGPAPHSHGVSATVRERAIGPLCTASFSGELASSVDLPKVLGGPLVAIPSSALNVFLGEPRLAGRTIDLTLFAVTRATDVLVGELWARRKTSRIAKGRWTSLESTIGQLTDAVVFAGSASLVMWAWLYLPDRLPRAYNKWIGDAAEVDARLVTALRRARLGEFFYGKNTGQAPMLQGMCRDYGLPLEYGDPATCVPLPCEVVHMGTGTSCEVHAVSRFLRAYRFSLAMYLPLNLLIKARSLSGRAIQQAVKDALRSSAFLAAFISLFYYGICLARTRLGPRLFSRYGFTAQDWDAGLGVGAGCTLCGWSILIEAERRRQEIALFVAPRAAATFFPRRYDPKYYWRETLAFTLSTATVFTCVMEKPERVRGMLGRVLKSVLSRD